MPSISSPSPLASGRRLALRVLSVLTVGCVAVPLQAQEHMVAPASPAASVSPSATPAAKGDLLVVLKAAGKYNTFLKALDAAGMTPTLSKDGPYTVFAPTDEAFAKWPAGTLDNLLKPASKAKLTALLSYHIAPGKVTIAMLTKMDELKTLNPDSIDVDTMADGKTIEMDDSKIIAPDQPATNGIVQGIDAVLQP